MYSMIAVPVDLAHTEALAKSIGVATDLAQRYDARVCLIGVTSEAPSPVARTPQEFAQKLDAFAASAAERSGVSVETKAVASHDPAVDLDATLIDTARQAGADLIVMASHVPGVPEHFFASHAGAVASHAEISVFVVR